VPHFGVGFSPAIVPSQKFVVNKFNQYISYFFIKVVLNYNASLTSPPEPAQMFPQTEVAKPQRLFNSPQ